MISVSKLKEVKALFSGGEVAGWKIVVDRSPRIVFHAGSNKFEVRDLVSRTSNANLNTLMGHLRNKLTHSPLADSVDYVVADRITQEVEHRRLQIALHEYGRDVYRGTLAAPQLTYHIQKATDKGDTSAEALTGIETDTKNRLVYNLKGSVGVADDTDGFDRFISCLYVDIKLNSNTGEWLATKNDLARSSYSILAEMNPADISDQELLDLILESAPQVV